MMARPDRGDHAKSIVASLALWQFPLLYCAGPIIGLGVYGSDFKTISGFIYLAPFLAMGLLRLIIDRRLPPPTRPEVVIGLYLGAIWATVTFIRLRLDFWDEHSLIQAVMIAGLSVFSLLASAVGARRLEETGKANRGPLAIAVALISAAYALCYWFPTIHFLAIGISLALTAPLALEIAPRPSPPRQTVNTDMRRKEEGLKSKRLPNAVAYAVIFWMSTNWSQGIWDYGYDTIWGPIAAGGVLLTSFGILIPFHHWRLSWIPPLMLALLDSLIVAANPAFVLNPMRSILSAPAMAWAFTHLTFTGDDHRAQHVNILRSAICIALGFGLSSIYAQQLEPYSWGRLMFILPAVAALARAYRRRRRASDLRSLHVQFES